MEDKSEENLQNYAYRAEMVENPEKGMREKDNTVRIFN